MNIVYQVTLHAVNILFLVLLGIFTVASFTNISAETTSPLDPITIGSIIFLFVCWVASYAYQITKKSWLMLVISNVSFLLVSILVVIVIAPFLFRIFDY